MTLLSAHRRPAAAHLLRQLTASAREQHHPGGSMQSMSGRRSEWATRHGDLDSDSRPRYTTSGTGLWVWTPPFNYFVQHDEYKVIITAPLSGPVQHRAQDSR
ncbi:hypothetical protein TgHK011_003584 [Trichoderma gracile]|nr:hypothetical protein TgHK011_003584 [Trichoderma gracile]